MRTISTATDGYKIGHKDQYQKGTTQVVANWTPRKSRIKGIDKVVFFGQQYLIKKYYIEEFNTKFFNIPENEAVKAYHRRIVNYLPPGTKVEVEHIRDLHRLGYLPIEIMSIPEGSSSPMRVPQSIMFATKPEFFWVVNYLETISSCTLWKPSTSATIAKEYKKKFDKYAMETVGNTEFTPWMGHDFAFRGMSGLEDAMSSGAGHLLNFYGTDTIPAIEFLETYYNADCEKELIGGSVAATEHAVMCSGTGFYVWDKYNGDWSHQGEAEMEVFKRLITETYPTGIISIVSDTWDLWKVITEYMVELKEVVTSRDGKVVIRPDSGNPCDILCGNPNVEINSSEYKGVIELLWNVYGGTTTEKGYKLLDSHVGTIYGDSITLDRAEEIMSRLKTKGFASINWVAGIGSYTYQYQTRDTFGFAQKSTYCEVKSSKSDEIYSIEIFKDPVTDDGTKKSARGLVAVYLDENGEYYMKDQVTWEEVRNCELKTVFKDGKLMKDWTLKELRENILDKKPSLQLV